MKRLVRPVLFVAAGALLGLGYYYLFGCAGNCAITSHPWMTMGYMGIIGGLLSGVIQKRRRRKCNM